ncbi:MAG: protein-L-isoaspartate(D-aspartate) O-methyltransferase [Bacteroidales bacterium]|nr:protein-L-isoaspartate(D-aspartate) O-methyltransferase [Bacteroidales bacterium]
MIDSYRHKGLRQKLVETINNKGIIDEKVLEAIGKVPRHLFMESGFVDFAYKDNAFPIGAGQTISQPFTVAYQTELLKIKEGDKVLEIGTGSGYQTAILLELGCKVYTIERKKELYLKVQTLLSQLGYKPHFFYGDGYQGQPTYGPYDKILITAAANSVPEKLKKQLKIGGIIVIPLGGSYSQTMCSVEKISENDYITTKHGEFVFVPLLKGKS